MRTHLRWLFRLSMAAIVAASASAAAAAQTVTTGTLSGLVIDEQGGVIPGADISATHQPTGTAYTSVTGGDGRFLIPYVRVGGPYVVTVTLAGFKTGERADVTVSLGEDRNLNFKLQVATVAEQVTVVAEANPTINPSRTGPAANISQEIITTLPTVARSLEDMGRLSPYFNATAQNADPTVLSVAGRNNRYNSVQIDGAVNNDLFGLSPSGAPGGQTEAQPVSLDAIQEIQLVVAPYDVRQGGFSGGGLNAITRSGTNALHGTGYYLARNQHLVGDLQRRPFGTFKENLVGGSAGGPVRRNRAFLFGNFEIERRSVPSGYSVGGSSGIDFGHVAEAFRIRNVLKNRYGYDPGTLDEFTRGIENNKVFVRGDLNLGQDHKLTARHNYLHATNDIGRLSLTEYFFPDYFYFFANNTNSTVVQLNSTLRRAFNEVRVTYQRVRDQRTGPTQFPSLEIRLPIDNTLFRAGRERSSTANALNQDVVEFTDDFTFSRGPHTFVAGTHNEFFRFANLFVQNSYGFYTFFSVEDFEAGFAQGYSFGYSTTGDLWARFRVKQLGVYLGDQWRPTSRLALTYGVRVEAPMFPRTPLKNPLTESVYGVRTDRTPEGTYWSPRIGFNYNRGQSGREQVRGGIGIFTGRTPYVWLSNQYSGTGVDFRSVSVTNNATNRIAFVVDPNAQPTLGSAAGINVSLMDPDYKYPQVVRWNLAYDREISGLVTTAEMLYSRNLQDIFYKNLNWVPGPTTRPDGRPIMVQATTAFANAYYLTNTDLGDQWTANLKVEKPFRQGFFWSGSYLYGHARAVNDGGSSTAASNWRFLYVKGDPNIPELGISNFDVRHRMNLAGSYRIPFGNGLGLTASVYYNLQSGRPYSTTFTNDMNGDREDNDIVYVPRNADEVIVAGGTWDELDAYITADSSLKDQRGVIPDRNSGRGPWTNTLDFRLAFAAPVWAHNVEITLDVQNLANLINSNWGLVRFPNFNEVSPFRYDGLDTASGKPIYNLSPMKQTTFRKFQFDDLRSRYQAQLGVRYRF